MRNYAGTCKGNCSYNLVYNFLIQTLPLQKPVFVMYFSSAFWHENEVFPKDGSQNEVVLLLLIVAIWLRQGGENMFSLLSLSKPKFFTCVALVSFVQHSSHTLVFSVASFPAARVALLSLVSGTRVVKQTRPSVYHNLAD